jgi:hypothetical protein
VTIALLTLFEIQVNPALVEVQTAPLPPKEIAVNVSPSADKSTAGGRSADGSFGRLFDTQVSPALVEVQTAPPPLRLLETTANVCPSADEATEDKPALGRLIDTQANPEFVEVQTPPLPVAMATNLVPLADDATLFQVV